MRHKTPQKNKIRFFLFKYNKFWRKFKKNCYSEFYKFRTSWYRKAFDLSKDFFQKNNFAQIDYDLFKRVWKINSRRNWNVAINETIRVFYNGNNTDLLQNFFTFFILQVYKKLHKRKIYTRLFRNNPYFRKNKKINHLRLDQIKRRHYYDFLKIIESTPNHNEYVIKLLKLLK